MAMPKARLIVKVERDDSASDGRGVMVTVRDGEHGNYGEPYRIDLAALKGAEVMRAAANVSAEQTHGSTGEQRIAAIVAKVHAEGYTPKEFVPMPRRERENVIQPPIQAVETLPENDSVESKPLVGTVEDQEHDYGPNYKDETPPAPTPVAGNKLAEALAELMPPAIDVEAVKSEVVAAAIQAVETRLTDVETVRIVIGSFERDDHDLPESHHAILPDVIRAVAAGNHVFLTGPAGSGKSTIAEQAFAALEMGYHPMSCDPSMMRHDIFGFKDANGNYHSTPAYEAYTSERGGLLVDEIDNGHPSILAGMNQMLANGSCSFGDGITHKKGDGFACIGTANTWGLGATAEYVGRNPIDAATLDRFTVRFYVDYDAKMERKVALTYASAETHALVSEWIDYAQGLRRKVRDAGVKVLVTPRATIAGAKLLANGVSMEDVKEWTVLAGMTTEIRGKVGA